MCLALCLWSACDERTPDLYSAPDGIYFNNRTSGSVLVDTTTLTFVYEPDETMYLDVPVVIQTIGRQADIDRPVNLKVWSDNAEEGVDYELLTPAVVPAHASMFSYVVRLKRTEAIKTELKSIYLELFHYVSGEGFYGKRGTSLHRDVEVPDRFFRLLFYSSGRMASRVCRRVFRT